MKRKTPPTSEPVIDPVIDPRLLDEAKRAIIADQFKRLDKCSVCGAQCAPNPPKAVLGLPRLKISAWRIPISKSLRSSERALVNEAAAATSSTPDQ